MERSEVLIVEAKQYSTDVLKVVVPSLFGYTEQARRIKKKVSVSRPPGVRWTKEKFINAIDHADISLRSSRTRALFELAESHPGTITIGYGRGRVSGSFIFKNNIGQSILVLWDNGTIQFYASGIMLDKIEFYLSLKEKYDDWLKWKAKIERGKSPGLVKRIEELSDEEFEKLKEFTLELARGTKEVEESYS
jgi:hypothetical protein